MQPLSRLECGNGCIPIFETNFILGALEIIIAKYLELFCVSAVNQHIYIYIKE